METLAEVSIQGYTSVINYTGETLKIYLFFEHDKYFSQTSL